MRLIDADLLKKNCKCTGKFEDNFKGVDLIELAKVIDAQPTAYDVSKVVEEFEKESKWYIVTQDGLNFGEKAIRKDKAVDIVKRGG